MHVVHMTTNLHYLATGMNKATTKKCVHAMFPVWLYPWLAFVCTKYDMVMQLRESGWHNGD